MEVWLERRLLDPRSRGSDLAHLKPFPEICISYKFPGDVDATGSGIHILGITDLG